METPKQIGRYEIIEELGRGAMGVVYRAKDPAMGRIVAVKTIISVALDGPQGKEFRERFFREARTAGALSHPGIVSMFDVGEHEGQPYLVMEFVPGPTLAQYARNRERLNVDRICELGAQLAEALGHAHARGVVHRDIKPANILITSGEAHGIERPKITDFGVAKLAEQHTTMTGQMVGTPAFMPPEQFTGAAIDGRSDIFSLGVMIYWLATGEQPFPGESITSISYKVVNADPAPPRRLNPALPARLDAIIMKCLAKSPEDRFQNGEEMARELNEVRRGATGQPAAAPRAFDPDATVVEMPSQVSSTASSPAATLATPAAPSPARAAAPAAAPAVSAMNPSAAAPPAQKSGSMVWVAAVAAVVLVLAGWFGLRSSSSDGSEPSATASSTISSAAPGPASDAASAAQEPAARPAASVAGKEPSAATPSAAAPASAASKPSAGAEASLAAATTKAAADGPAKSASAKKAAEPAAPPPPARVDFDPKALDKKTNARLELDTSRLPGALEFALLMNDRIYLDKPAGTAYKKDGDLFVPPGVHEFHVVARDGAVEKSSNTVSTDFKANKRSTLKVELRVAGRPAEAGMPNGLYPDSQLVLTLK